MEDVLLPKSFSCSTPSSEEEDETPEPQAESVIVTVPPAPAPPKKQEYDAKWAALALMFLAVFMCVAIILWYIFTNSN